jgi:hypothetical protein
MLSSARYPRGRKFLIQRNVPTVLQSNTADTSGGALLSRIHTDDGAAIQDTMLNWFGKYITDVGGPKN